MVLLKIAQICPRYFPNLGGVQTYIKEISERLNGNGFEIEIITSDSKGVLPKEEVINGVNVKRFNAYAPGNAYTFSYQMYSYLKKNTQKYDILHAHQYHALPALYAHLSKKNAILYLNTYYHGKGHTFFRNLLHLPYKAMGKRILDSSNKIICISKHEKELLLKNFDIDENKILIIPCGINIDEFNLTKKEKEKRLKKILTVSRIEKYKGIQYLIDSIELLDDSIQLHIVGRGPYKEQLINKTKKMGLNNRVFFSENLSREELIQNYYDSDLFALISKYESYGIVVAEALASGTPCIVADTSALSEWVDGENCFGIEYPIDINDLTELISKTIGKKVSIKELISWDKTANMIKQLYRREKQI
jgi:glycosyltransferase involved in cell wall biosynthesis